MPVGLVNNETGSVTLDLGTLGLAAGVYYVGVIADDTNVISESDETNNSSTAMAVSIPALCQEITTKRP